MLLFRCLQVGKGVFAYEVAKMKEKASGEMIRENCFIYSVDIIEFRSIWNDNVTSDEDSAN